MAMLEIIYPSICRLILENVKADTIDLPEDVIDVSVRGPGRGGISVSRLGIYGIVTGGKATAEYRRIVTGNDSYYYTDGLKKFSADELIGISIRSRWAIHRPRGIAEVTVTAVIPCISAVIYYEMSLAENTQPCAKLLDINMMARIINKSSFPLTINKVLIHIDTLKSNRIISTKPIENILKPPMTLYANSNIQLCTYNDHSVDIDISAGTEDYKNQYNVTITPRELEFSLPALVTLTRSGSMSMIGTGQFDGKKIISKRNINGYTTPTISMVYTLDEAYPEQASTPIMRGVITSLQ